MPNPTKCSPELTAHICDLIRRGWRIVSACQAVGISKTSYYNWRVQGDKGEEPFDTFLEDVEQAEAIAFGAMAEKVFRGDADWISAMTFLERRDRDGWGKHEKHELEHTGSISVTFNVTEMEPNGS